MFLDKARLLGLFADFGRLIRKNRCNMRPMTETVTTKAGTFEIISEAHEPIGRVVGAAEDGSPEQSVLLVAKPAARRNTCRQVGRAAAIAT